MGAWFEDYLIAWCNRLGDQSPQKKIREMIRSSQLDITVALFSLRAVDKRVKEVHSDAGPLGLLRQVQEACKKSEPLNAWMGQGLSIVKGRVVEPLDTIRDWLYLTDWKENQSSILRVEPTVAVLIPDSVNRHNPFDVELIKENTEIRARVFQAFNKVWHGNVKVITSAEIEK
jgi:hypothetical protein